MIFRWKNNMSEKYFEFYKMTNNFDRRYIISYHDVSLKRKLKNFENIN